MSGISARTEKILLRINELAAISEEADGITRTFGSAAFLKGSEKVLSWMREAGLQPRIDNIGNVRGRVVSSNPHALTFIIASHIDTVVNAGKFDGPLGVLMGLDILEEIIRANIELPFNIELIAFSDEEGVRFHTTFLGSRVVAGSFDKSLLEKKDESGTSLLEVIGSMGGNADILMADAIAGKDCLGYFEMHIEQGPVLYEKKVPAAVVTAIAGQSRIEVVFKGMAGHAGTVPMDMRRDALCCAAEFILETEKLALASKKKVVATIGKIQVANQASNVIPGEVVCSLDIRSAKQENLATACERLKEKCATICLERAIDFEWKIIQQTAPVDCDQGLNEMLSKCVADAGYEEIFLVSGAGHDAVPMSAITPVSMLFIRCFKGISHNPLENADKEDIAASLQIADNFIQALIKKHN